ncbi:hypothetical protein WN944_007673 [Citrus x changshan-huyou]|uniref:Uncharacterized protein n=1 Tax=Citrus x changshan-huyou TaxID=2935761 RepID=A0AAP0MNF0_9ROSI
MELERCARQKPCRILVFDYREKQMGFSKITPHAVIDDKVIFSQSIIYVRGVGCLDMGDVQRNMLQEIACHNSLGFCVGVSRGDLKGEKIQYNQNANVMEFLVQLAKLRDEEGNNVMQNLAMVLVNEFGTSKKADKINEKERKFFYDYYIKTMQF